MQKWEYLFLSRNSSGVRINGKLPAQLGLTMHEHANKLGEKGWELISSTDLGGQFATSGQLEYVFKRPKT